MDIGDYITLEEAKDQVAVEHDFEGHDEMLGRLIEAAGRTAVQFLNVESIEDVTEDGEVFADVKHAILLLVGLWFENREGAVVGSAVNELPFSVNALLWPYRREVGI